MRTASHVLSLPLLLCLFDLVSPLIHARSEKFDAVDAARTGDLMVVTELWEDGLDLAPIAQCLWGQGLESLDCPSTVCILMDMPIRGNHGVVGRIMKLQTGTKEGDGALIAALQDCGGVGREPGPPNGIRERASLLVNIAHGVVGSRDRLWLHPSVPRDDELHVFIGVPRSRGSLRMLPGVLAIEQDGDSLLIGSLRFFLRDLPPRGERNVEVSTLLQRQPLCQF